MPINYEREDGIIKPIKPKYALDSFMQALDGDKSPLSYLQAAVLYHEINEYGTSWHYISWKQEVILPVYYVEEPETINPHFYYDEDENPIIVFYTINDIGTITLNEYKHIFSKENYDFKIEKKILGTAGEGTLL